MKRCSKCNQEVIGKHRLCYYHRKIRDGLIVQEKEDVIDTPLDLKWHIHIEKIINNTASKLGRESNCEIRELAQVGWLLFLLLKNKMNMEYATSQIKEWISYRLPGLMHNHVYRTYDPLDITGNLFYDDSESVEDLLSDDNVEENLLNKDEDKLNNELITILWCRCGPVQREVLTEMLENNSSNQRYLARLLNMSEQAVYKAKSKITKHAVALGEELI